MAEEEKKVEETVTEEQETVTEETPANPEEEEQQSQEETKEESSTEEEESPKEEDEESEEEEKTEDEEISPETVKEAGVDKATEVLKDKGFDYAELQKEFAEKGEISQETREQLAKVGITGEIVDNYIEGQKARVEQEINEIAECIGGRKQLDTVIQWAAKNLSDEEKLSINGVKDSNVMKIILKDLKARMEEKEGKVPEGTVTGEGSQPAVELYESQAQMFEAIRDPRYKTDEAYRAKVMKKIQASREAGIDLGI